MIMAGSWIIDCQAASSLSTQRSEKSGLYSRYEKGLPMSLFRLYVDGILPFFYREGHQKYHFPKKQSLCYTLYYSLGSGGIVNDSLFQRHGQQHYVAERIAAATNDRAISIETDLSITLPVMVILFFAMMRKVVK